jgi:hypothetical protein
MMIDSSFAALVERFKLNVNRVNAALLKHERTLAVAHGHSDDGHRELYGTVHRLARLIGDLKNALATPAPARY